MKVLVTGGAGFIGSHLVDALIEKNHEVTVIDDLSCGKKENVNEKAKLVQMDIRDKKLADVFKEKKPEIVFHLAAQKNVRISVADPCLDADINIIGSLNLLENCRKHQSKVIFSSTGGAIYGDTEEVPTPETHPETPISPYGVAKLAIEKYLYYYQTVFGLAYVSLRYANVYGPRQDPKGEAGVVAIFAEKMLKNEAPLIFGHGRQTRDYVYVSDVVKANLLVMPREIKGIYNVGTSQETSVNDLFGQMAEIGNFQTEEKHGPAVPGEQRISNLSFQKIKKELGWSPEISLKEGLNKTINWFKERNEKKEK